MFERLLLAVYRVLSRAYPASFRDEFGRDLEETFLDRFRDTRGAAAVLGFVLVAVADVVLSGLRERISPFLPGPQMLHWSDIRYAFRLLTRAPFFSAITVVVLAGGLGLSIFTFSFLYTAMIKPLPLASGDAIVRVSTKTAGSTRPIDAVDLAAMRPSITTLIDVGAYTSEGLVLGDDTHRRLIYATVTESNLFDVARGRPILGRTLRPDDQAPGAEPVIVLCHWAWRVLFGEDSTVVGRRVVMNGGFVRVVGVMPDGYGFPVSADAWMPLSTAVLATKEAGRHALNLYARLAPGANIARANAELTQLLGRVTTARVISAEERAEAPTQMSVETFQMAQMGNQGPAFFAILNLLATLILLLACINVLNLLLARANERARETAVRLALGASRGRLVMQSMWESVVLCVAGGVLATAIAAWGLDVVNRWTHTNMPRNLAFWWVWGLDRAGIIAAGGFVTMAISVLGGVVAAR